MTCNLLLRSSFLECPWTFLLNQCFIFLHFILYLILPLTSQSQETMYFFLKNPEGEWVLCVCWFAKTILMKRTRIAKPFFNIRRFSVWVLKLISLSHHTNRPPLAFLIYYLDGSALKTEDEKTSPLRGIISHSIKSITLSGVLCTSSRHTMRTPCFCPVCQRHWARS